MVRTIRLDAVYPFPPVRVWHALTDPRALAEWLSPTDDFAPHLGQRFTFRGPSIAGPDNIVYCEVLEVDEPRRLSYSWRGSGLETRVTWTLEPITTGTHLRLEHAGFAGWRGIGASVRLGSIWKRMLDRTLRQTLRQA